MDNPYSGYLSPNDRILLKRIESYYEIGVQLIGNEPYIYHQFHIVPDSEPFGAAEKLSGLRHDAFKSSKPKKKKL